MNSALTTLLAAIVTLGLVGCDEEPAPTSCDTGLRCTPVLTGEYQLVYKPSSTRYLNDHTIIKGPDARWHVIGITDTSLGNPQAEKTFLHASATALEGPWTEEPDALTAAGDEVTIWAPHIVALGPAQFAMFYFPNNPRKLIYRADSTDLFTWKRSPLSVPGGRDPFVLKRKNEWLMYSVGVSPEGRGRIIVARSRDLETWTETETVIEDPVPSFTWGNLESPFVVQKGERFYLFLTRTSESPADYTRTVVFTSANPLRFDWSPLTDLHSHAGEVVDDGDKNYLSSGGWTANIGEAARGLSLAPLNWVASGLE